MKNLNEHIARKANKEDKVKGHFWESRYKCQALLDDKALLTAMAYVDLNPVRAVMAETPEESEFTSVCERIRELKSCQVFVDTGDDVVTTEQGEVESLSVPSAPSAPLMPFDGSGTAVNAIPFALHDYLELVDWGGRVLYPDKRGAIDADAPHILRRVGLDPALFIQCANDFMYIFGLTVGSPQAMAACCARRQVKFLRGMKAAREMLGAA
jgi:hypothetical protein